MERPTFLTTRKTFPLFARLRPLLLAWENPFLAAALAAVIFSGLSATFTVPWRVSSAPYYNYLADAFLHGQLNLRLIPPSLYDLSVFQGKYYLQWGPLPGVLAMPWVALFGVQSSDVLQTIIVGALNAGIFALLLRRVDRRGWAALTPERRALLSLFFTLGTAMTPLPAVGMVWYLVQLESVTAALLAFLAAFSLEGEKAFFWTGCAVAGIMLTRISAIFVAVFLAWYLLRRHWSLGWRRPLRACLVGLLPVAVAGGLLLAYNLLRFGQPFENGASFHLMGPQYVENFKRYGYLSLHYAPVNAYFTYIDYPFLSLRQRTLETAGGSLFLLSPLLLGAIYALWQDRADKDTWALLLAVLLGNIPVMMIMAPGSVNFGPRYALDFILPVLMLTLRGVRRWPLPWIGLLALASVVQYLIGSVYLVYLFQL